MKNILILFILFLSTSIYAQVGINTDTPEGILDVVSEDSGVLLPRLTNTQIKNIENAVEGMIVYNTSVKCLMVNLRSYDDPKGTDWRCLVPETKTILED